MTTFLFLVLNAPALTLRGSTEAGLTALSALLDVLYLGSARSRLFERLPELALPGGFGQKGARLWIERIRDPARRSMVRARLDEVLGRTASGHSRSNAPSRLPPGRRRGAAGRRIALGGQLLVRARK